MWKDRQVERTDQYPQLCVHFIYVVHMFNFTQYLGKFWLRISGQCGPCKWESYVQYAQ